MRNVRVDHTGRRYNQLVALSYYGRSKTKTLWWFQCDCGTRTVKCIYSVKSGHTKSCGCLQPEVMSRVSQLPAKEVVLKRAYGSHIRQSRRRGFISHLTLNDYAEIVCKPCRYCGRFSKRCTRRKLGPNYTMEVNSVDRLNNEPYYKLDNSVPACFVCQRMKSNLGEKEFLEAVRAISNFQFSPSNSYDKMAQTTKTG